MGFTPLKYGYCRYGYDGMVLQMAPFSITRLQKKPIMILRPGVTATEWDSGRRREDGMMMLDDDGITCKGMLGRFQRLL